MYGKCGDVVTRVKILDKLEWYCEFHGVTSPGQRIIPTFLEDFGILPKVDFREILQN